jgi:ribonuclease HI
MARNKVRIYADGACSGNHEKGGGSGGYAAILSRTLPDGSEKRRNVVGKVRVTTNNRMELMAVIQALDVITNDCDIDIYVDSSYVTNGYNKKWIEGWKKRGWKKSDGKPVKNKDLWIALDKLLSFHNFTFHWVKGHNGHEYNEECDRLAVEAIRWKEEGKLDLGYQENQ